MRGAFGPCLKRIAARYLTGASLWADPSQGALVPCAGQRDKTTTEAGTQVRFPTLGRTKLEKPIWGEGVSAVLCAGQPTDLLPKGPSNLRGCPQSSHFLSNLLTHR